MREFQLFLRVDEVLKQHRDIKMQALSEKARLTGEPVRYVSIKDQSS